MKKIQGFLAIVALVVVIIFGLIGVIATYLVTTGVTSSANNLASTQALYIAEAGLNTANHGLNNTIFANRVSCSGVASTYTFTGAKGPFTLTSARQLPTASTLSSAISASSTTIPLNDASTYPDSGRVMIDRELMSYMGKSGNTLLNVARARDETIATSHASGAPVGQYQCSVTSVGSVPSASPSADTVGGERTLSTAIELSEAWIVGAAGKKTETLMHWNNPTELAWTDASTTLDKNDLNAVYMVSNADVWAVGKKGETLHWNGNSLSRVTSATAKNLNDVFCLASNYCWAVGSAASFEYWNGNTWSDIITTIPAININSVYCLTTTSCWAVGDASTISVIAYWNGLTWVQNLSVTSIDNLNGVTCTASNNCWAVGSAGLILHWNGLLWSATPTGLTTTHLNAVDCISSSDCWVVGDKSGGGSFAAHWNGSAWTRDASASAASSENLDAVQCRGASNCWAVGKKGTILHWDGSTWSAISSPLSDDFYGVSLVGPRDHPMSAWHEVYPS